MPLVLHRSNRTEALVATLCAVLRETLPADPFQRLGVVVGSRGMERWLRHEIATRLDLAAGLDFPFPRQALAGAARWLIAGAPDPHAPFWLEPAGDLDEAARWERDALAARLVGRLRAHRGEPDFAAVDRYLGDHRAPSDPVSARELLFASEVADALDRLMHDRAPEALRWAGDPAGVEGPHRWLARLLADLGAHTHPASPAVQHRALLGLPPGEPAAAAGRVLCVFGLSTMGPGDRQRLAALARTLEVHLFVLAPTTTWLGHQLGRAQAHAARRAAPSDEARQALEQALRDQNPILASLGAPSRDLQAWLEDCGYQGDRLPALDPARGEQPTLLQRLQGWILAAEGVDAADPPWPADPSLAFHSTYGARRQCEVLRDQLLDLFARDPTLEPRHVLVMTPDIATYAPLVAAVFARGGGPRGPAGARPAPPIPVAVADLGLRRTNPVAEVLLEVLEMAGDRLRASWVADFLALEPVRLRWGLDEADLADLRLLLREAGLRWGMDAEDRRRADQPALDQNTARFALERLALGVLMPDEDPPGVVPDPSGRLDPAVPLPIERGERARRVGQLAGILRALDAHRRALAAPGTLADWRDRLVALLDDLSATRPATTWLRAQVDATLEELAALDPSLDGLPVERAAVSRWLQGRYEVAQRGDRPITGAVQVCSLEPMRSVPFRVVALLGMDDGAFPRGSRPRSWDPMDPPRPGERDRREIDRHILLEALLSAREHLLILWSGRDPQRGEAQPAAVPIEELIETVGQLTGQTREALVREHPLQPWSPASFGAQGGSYDTAMAQAATRLQAIARDAEQARPLGLATRVEGPLPAEEEGPRTLALDTLARALLTPQRRFFGDRLGLWPPYREGPVQDREPLELDHLEWWTLRNRVLDLRVRTDPDQELSLDALRDRLAGEGRLPPGSAGRGLVEQAATEVRELLAHLDEVAGVPADALDLDLDLDGGLRLVGRVERVREREGRLLLQWATPSKETSERVRLTAWVHLLAAAAAGCPVDGAQLVGKDSKASKGRPAGLFLGWTGTAEAARDRLGALVDLWRQAHDRPLPLFKYTSPALAKALAKAGDPVPGAAWPGLIQAVRAAWSGTDYAGGDADERWIAPFYLDEDPANWMAEDGPLGLVGLARAVWGPLLAAGADLERLARWTPEAP